MSDTKMTPTAWKLLAMLALVIVWVAALGRGPSTALGGESAPVRVDDRHGVLPPYDRARMGEYLQHIQDETGIDIRLVFADAGGKPLDVFAAAEAARLGIGRESGLRGLLVAYDVGARRMRIELGYGLEEYFPDAFIGRLIEDQVRWHFQEGDPGKLHLMLRIMHWRIRDHMLGGRFDPVKHGDRGRAAYVSGGAGASGTVPLPGDQPRDLGSMEGFRAPLDDRVRATFGPQPTPEAAFERRLAWLALGRYDAQVEMFTPASRSYIQGMQLTPPYMEFLWRHAVGQRYEVVRRGDRAMLYFTSTPLLSPLFFRHSAEGWRNDIEEEVRCSREYSGSFVTWTFLTRCASYAHFQDRLVELGTGILRVRGGDNRPLPTPRMQETYGPMEDAVEARRWPADVMTTPVLPDADAFGYPPTSVDKLALLGLLRERRWDDLEQRLGELTRQSLADVRYEYHVLAAYGTFRRADIGPLLDAWAEARPRSAEARVARAQHALERAWDARGTASSTETPRDALRSMREQVGRAHRELDAALALEPRLPVAHDIRISLYRLEGRHRAAFGALRAGLDLMPLSVSLREGWLSMLWPRWGGSYAAMRSVAEDTRDLRPENPRLTTLDGKVHDALGYALEGDAALREYARALEYGDDQVTLRHRAREHGWAGAWDLALADLNRAWMLQPEHTEILYWRARALYKLARVAVRDQQDGLFARAEADAVLADAILPEERTTNLLEWIRWCRNWPERCRS